MSPRIRPFDWTSGQEVDAVADLHRAVGWPARTADAWRWLASNPARARLESPLGWVAVDGADRPVGVLCNLTIAYPRPGSALIAAVGFSVTTSAHGRGAGSALVRDFLRQPGIFAASTLNANPAGAPLYARLGMSPWPVQTHALKLAWIVDPVACAFGRAYRLIVDRPRLVAALGERLADRKPDAPVVPVDPHVRAVTDVGPGSSWDAYRLRMERELRLRPDRSPDLMAWRAADPQAVASAVVLGVFQHGDLIAHARARTGKGNALEVSALEILDMDWIPGHAAAVPRLMRSLFDLARRRGVGKLRLQVVSPRVRGALGPWLDRARVEGGWGHGKRALMQALPAPWDPTPFDGDHEICLRPPPPQTARRAA